MQQHQHYLHNSTNSPTTWSHIHTWMCTFHLRWCVLDLDVSAIHTHREAKSFLIWYPQKNCHLLWKNRHLAEISRFTRQESKVAQNFTEYKTITFSLSTSQVWRCVNVSWLPYWQETDGVKHILTYYMNICADNNQRMSVAIPRLHT